MVFIGYAMMKNWGWTKNEVLGSSSEIIKIYVLCKFERIILLTSSDIKISFIMVERASQCPNRDDPRAKKTGRTQCRVSYGHTEFPTENWGFQTPF